MLHLRRSVSCESVRVLFVFLPFLVVSCDIRPTPCERVVRPLSSAMETRIRVSITLDYHPGHLLCINGHHSSARNCVSSPSSTFVSRHAVVVLTRAMVYEQFTLQQFSGMNHTHPDPTHLRPGFPKGLHVLLVEEDCASIEAQLRQPELQYAVTCAHNAMEALELLRYANGKFAKSVHYDIILADARLVATEDTTGKAFIDACEGVPVVLMAEQGSAKDVLRSVQLGAVDFLDKPLSTLKLKNIWQHCVRKMMRSSSSKSIPKNFEVIRPCYSADVAASTAHTLAPVPSSMTGPIVPGANAGYVSTGIAGYAGAYGSVGNQLNQLGEHGKQVASPQTPSGSDIEGAAGESMSAASNHDGDNKGSKNDNKSDDGDVKSKKKKAVVRRKKMAEVETRQWPALEAGCTWGTPVGSVLPPLMVRPKGGTATDDALIGAPSGLPPSLPPSMPAAVTSNAHSSGETSDPSIQRCIIKTPSALDGGDSKAGMQSGQFFKNTPGGAPPLGLKLRKTDSLLNLINDRLGS